VRINGDGGDGDLVFLVGLEDARRGGGGIAVGDDDDVLLPGVGADQSTDAVAAVQGEVKRVIEAGHVAELHALDGGDDA
jgi:hypothetical protein